MSCSTRNLHDIHIENLKNFTQTDNTVKVRSIQEGAPNNFKFLLHTKIIGRIAFPTICWESNIDKKKQIYKRTFFLVTQVQSVSGCQNA